MKPSFTLLGGIFLLSILLAAQPGHSQVNLIPNAGFETNTGMPSGPGQYARAVGWGNVNGYPAFAWPYASPDYFHLGGSGLALLPNAFPGYSYPHGGSAVFGALLWYSTTSNFREYFTANLSSPLVVGTNYEFSIWVRAAANPSYGGHGCNCIGANFTVGPMSQNTHEPLNITPTVETPTVFYNNAAWQLLSFTFTATQPATYVTIGNFHNDATTQPVYFSPTSGGSSIYFLFDDCAVVESIVLPDGGIQLQGSWKDEVAQLSWEATSDLPEGHFTLQRSMDGNFYQGISEEIHHPTALHPKYFDSYQIPGPRYYRVVHRSLNGEMTYSNTVEMNLGSGSTLVLNNLFPNPATERSYVEFFLAEPSEVNITVRDMLGREVKRLPMGQLDQGMHTLPVEVDGLAAGTYTLTLQQGATQITRKWMVR